MKLKPYTKSLHLASVACVIHCIVTPFLIVVTPFLSRVFQNMLVELSLLIVSILCGTLIIYSGYCKHKKVHSCLLFSMGAILWMIHSYTSCRSCLHQISDSLYFLLGTGLVLISYYTNHHFLKCCPSECCNH